MQFESTNLHLQSNLNPIRTTNYLNTWLDYSAAVSFHHTSHGVTSVIMRTVRVLWVGGVAFAVSPPGVPLLHNDFVYSCHIV